ncbi:MAG TPA: four helix bundle protein [Vicinamibacterales bacterium]|nr:four helix bundle protein [Vicinamibacterales bacterium]
MARTVRELQVFQRACVAADELFALLRHSQLGRDRDLGAQLNRASIRIVSDVAEGFEQKTDRHFAKYLYDARGGSAEIRAQLSVAQSRGYIPESEAGRVIGLYDEIGRMLSGLIKYLEAHDRKDRHK